MIFAPFSSQKRTVPFLYVSLLVSQERFLHLRRCFEVQQWRI